MPEAVTAQLGCKRFIKVQLHLDDGKSLGSE